MKRSFLSLTLFLMLVPSLLSAASCPTKSTEDWVKFFKEQAKLMSRNSTSYSDELAKIAEACKATWNLKGVGKCSERLADAAVARRKADKDGGSMGWQMSDRDYNDSIPKEFITLPRELQDGLPANYREVAKRKGWKVFKYRSRTVPNPPNRSYNRVLIVVEGAKDDKYIQFTISDDPNRPNKPEQLIDYLSVEHNKQNPDKNAQIHFGQFWRDANGRNPENKAHQGKRFDNCYQCHPNGVRELSPEPGSYSKEDAGTLEYLKKKMSSYGKIEFNGALDPKAYGAPMGKEQGCVKCHNNYEGQHLQSRGALNHRTSGMHIGHKMTADYSMPLTSLDAEKDLQKTIDQIPSLLSEAELKDFHSKIRRIGQDEKNEWAIDELKRLGKIDAAKHKKLKFVLNGHPDYPNCLGAPDCFMGIKKTYAEMYRKMKTNYPKENEEWFVAKCSQEFIRPGLASEVNDSGRSEGNIFSRGWNYLFGDDDNGSQGSQR
ncbi:MAG: hypothetical protein KC493_02795 [Bacteriovoracaceae bacterium]|nr:hypothetical protein [Bacteriovoracaceae bacterium]